VGVRISAGRFKGRALPAAGGARPAPGRLKTSLFSVLADRLEGAHVLDVCAGVGALGLEALSRGAASVVLVERDARAVRALLAWLADAGVGAEARVLRRDALRGALPPGPFDLVFLDPPFALWADEGLARDLLGRALTVLARGGLLVVKLPGRQEIPADSRLATRARREVGSVAWALLEAASAAD
jgi:16S rRNA (guanine966-N2)-methyltransferase